MGREPPDPEPTLEIPLVDDGSCPPERMRFDTVVDGVAQRAVYSGTPYYRALSDSRALPRTIAAP